MTLTVEEPKTAAPKHAKPMSKFDEIVRPLVENGIPTPCELEFEEMCELAPRLAHFVVSFVKCDCKERQSLAVCEPCLKAMMEEAACYCLTCGVVWAPAKSAIGDVVRIRS